MSKLYSEPDLMQETFDIPLWSTVLLIFGIFIMAVVMGVPIAIWNMVWRYAK